MTTTAFIPRLLSCREAATRLGVLPHTLRRLAAVGAVRTVRLTLPAPLRFTEADLLDAIENGRTR